MLVRLSTLSLAAFLLCGCQSMGAAFSNAISNTIDWIASDENPDPPREIKDFTPEVKLSILWNERVGKGDSGNFLGLGLVSGKPVEGSSGATIYAADYAGSVTALDLTGKKLFKVQNLGPLSAGPTLFLDAIVLGTLEGEVISFSAASGRTLWTAKVPGEILAPPAVSGESVIVLTSDGAVFALSPVDGRLLWSLGRRSSPLSLRGSCPPKILPNGGPQGEDLVLVGFANGKMALLEVLDGKVLWEKQLASPVGRSELEQLVDIDSAPVVDGETFFVTAFHGGVIASTLAGEVLWRNEDVIAHRGPQLGFGRLFVTDVKGDIWSLDKSTGRAYFKQDLLHQRQPTAPVVYGDFLAVGDYEGYVHLLAQEDGREVARARVSRHPIRVDPLVVDPPGVLLVLASDGNLSALQVEP
jgi:outer membrane protein assembly factor BamB